MERAMRRVWAVGILLLGAMAIPILAQQPATQPAGALDPEHFFKQLHERYRALGSYSDRCTTRCVLQLNDLDGTTTTYEYSWTSTTRMLGLDKLRAECGGAVYIQGGDEVTFAVPGVMRFQGKPQSPPQHTARPVMQRTCTMPHVIGMYSPAMLAFTHPLALHDLPDYRIAKLISITDELVGLVPCQRIKMEVASTIPGAGDRGPRIAATVVVRKSDGLVVSVRGDLGPTLRQMGLVLPMFGMFIKSCVVTIDIADIDAAPTLDPAVFDYTPVDTERVHTQNLASQSGMTIRLTRADTVNLIGKPAPRIELPDLDGKPFKLNDCKGKVVVLVFGSLHSKSNCFPIGVDCVPRLKTVQEAVAALKGRPVMAVAAMQEWIAPLSEIREGLQTAGFAGTALRDPAGLGTMRYATGESDVGGQIVIVDGAGNVADVVLSEAPLGPGELRLRIETALAGRPVRDEAGLALLKEAAAKEFDPLIEINRRLAEQPQPTPKPVGKEHAHQQLNIDANFGPFNADALVSTVGPPNLLALGKLPGITWFGNLEPESAKEIDIDRDGTPELAFQLGPRLCVLSSDGETFNTIFTDDMLITEVELLQLSDTTSWFIYNMGHSIDGLSQRPPTFKCIDPAGKVIWCHEFLESGSYIRTVMARAVDLDVDGELEIVLAMPCMHTFEPVRRGQERRVAGGMLLMVLDRQGRLLARRTYDQEAFHAVFITSPAAGKPPTIMLISTQQSTRLRLDSSLMTQKPASLEAVADAYLEAHRPTPEPQPTPPEMVLPVPAPQR